MTEDQDPAVDAAPDGAADHYFTARPASAAERRTISVRLAGRDVEVEVASGVFSPGGLDLGTQVLLRTTPPLDDVLAVTVAAARHTFLHEGERRALVDRIVRPARTPGTARPGRHRA